MLYDAFMIQMQTCLFFSPGAQICATLMDKGQCMDRLSFNMLLTQTYM